MGSGKIKRDRTARLLRIQLLLGQYSEGLDIKTIARMCSTHVRTVYRDLEALETELNVPIWEEGKKRGIVEGYFLPPVTFNLSEAVTVFSCARLMYNHLRVCNPGMISAFMQLGSIMPQPLRKQIQNTISHIEKLPRNERRMNNYNKLLSAWLSQHSVVMHYQEYTYKDPIEVTVDPYFIEANTTKHYNYVVGYCHTDKSIGTFKIDRIVGVVFVDESLTFEIPSDFDVDEYRDTEWGTCANEKSETIKLRFSPGISKDIIERPWQSSHKIDNQPDGSIIIILKTKNSVEFCNWILSFGRDVEVLEPGELRKQMISYINSLKEIYTGDRTENSEPPKSKLLSHRGPGREFFRDKRKLDSDKIVLIRHKVLVEKQSVRSVAKQIGVSRNTVTKYLVE
jgi:predicted DNA-binding transcriptional regulator YafY